MKKIFWVSLILHAVFSSRCVERTETHEAWEKINSAMPEPKMLERSHNDSVINDSTSIHYQLADSVRILFKRHRSNPKDYSSLQGEVNNFRGMPQNCAKAVNQMLAKKATSDRESLALLDSTEVVVLQCLFSHMVD